jgi:hypothetical protein
MKALLTAGALGLALGIGIAACSDDLPTAPSSMSSTQSDRSGPVPRGQSLSFDVAGPMTNRAGEVVANFAGTMRVTKFGYDEAAQKLMVTGILNGTATYVDGTTPPVNIVDQLVTTTATLKKGAETASMSTASPYQFASSVYHFTATCGILLLDLGPLHLDLLGLVVDLNEVILSITGETGAGNLLGNLLCAITGLLDGAGALAGILNLIDSINNLLGSIGGLATPAGGIPPFGGFDIAAPALAIFRSA